MSRPLTRIKYGPPRRRGMGPAAVALGVTYGHLYRCVKWLNGERGSIPRQPGAALAAAIHQQYPELIKKGKPC